MSTSIQKLTFAPILRNSGEITQARQVSSLLADVIDAHLSMYERTGYLEPWIGYLAKRGGEYIGACAFKTPPQNGFVEIAYFTFPTHEGKGIGTAMARHLIAIAEQTDPDICVMAQTLPEENASTSILRKLGFTLIGTVNHPEDGQVWEWHFKSQ